MSAVSKSLPTESVMNPRVVHYERRRATDTTSARVRAAQYSALIIIDSACEVKTSFIQAQRSHEAVRFLSAGGTRLLPEIELPVRTMIDAMESSQGAETLLLLAGERAMRLSPLVNVGEKLFALVVEADRNENCIARAASRYGLTKRQIEVLLLVLEGANAGNVAKALKIAEYTAQGHIKALLVKTESRNRATMIAKILDWSPVRPAIKQAIPIIV
jgi:DNA-binding CsgD family transcriptional regulator